MNDHGPRYHWSAAAAAEILNLHDDRSEPKAVRFAAILYTILNAMYRAEEDLRLPVASCPEPSEN